jgi:hypothetical protein
MIYDLERANKHQFWYVPRDESLDVRTGTMQSIGTPVRCLGVVFDASAHIHQKTSRGVKDMGVQPYNNWNFLVRTHWIATISRSSLFSYNGKAYEILNYCVLEGGFLVEAITTNRVLEIYEETVTISLPMTETIS